MNLDVAFVYSRTIDSEYTCGRGFPWGDQGHCDASPYTQKELGVTILDAKLVFCGRCTNNYTECDLHYTVKSTAILMAASGLLRAKATSRLVVSFYF